jgi:hypothetical protein
MIVDPTRRILVEHLTIFQQNNLVAGAAALGLFFGREPTTVRM